MNNIKKVFVIFVMIFCANSSLAEDIKDPIILLQNVTDKIFVKLKQHKIEISQNPSFASGVVRELILPHVDFIEMSRWVAGRNAWKNASAASKKEFIQEFKKLVVRTYASSLNNYTEEVIQFLPLRTSIIGKKRIMVSSIVKKQAGEAIRLDYRLIRSGNTWKLYDLTIEGVSLLKGYQAQFSDDIRQKNLDYATLRMRAHKNDQS